MRIADRDALLIIAENLENFWPNLGDAEVRGSLNELAKREADHLRDIAARAIRLGDE